MFEGVFVYGGGGFALAIVSPTGQTRAMTKDDLALAARLADAAGNAIRPFFRAAFTHEAKGDASPVTEADRAAEAAMRSILDAERPMMALSVKNMA